LFITVEIEKKSMKRIFLDFIALSVTAILIICCENQEHLPSGRVVGDSGCKNLKSGNLRENTPDTLSCIYYSFNESSEVLTVNHINAGFNCCPGKLSCNVSVSGDTLIIKEYEKSALCDCNCLYDIEIEISEITINHFIVKIVEPYCGNQEKIIFEINLDASPVGTFCVTRKFYPWRMGS
jgi:hypothetical protein